jgi:hypothetical protein
MNHRLAVAVVLALTLGACATYDGSRNANGEVRDGGYGYYMPGHDGYGDYYYGDPQFVLDEHYAPGWGGAYWGGYGFSYPGFGFGYGSGYYGGYSDPWWYGGYDYRRRHHDHDHDDDDRGNDATRNDTSQHRAEQFTLQNRDSGFNMSKPRASDSSRGRPDDFGARQWQQPEQRAPGIRESHHEWQRGLPRRQRDPG